MSKLHESTLLPASQSVAFKPQIVWIKAVFIGVIHLLALYGISVAHHDQIKLQTIYYTLLMGFLSSIGVQVAAHRLWSHRAFKANAGLRLFLAACQTMAGQKSIYYWARDHRLHHRYSETVADPHDSRRGFWFAHVGWIYTRKHPEVLRKGAQLDLSDLEADAIVMFQRRYYVPLLLLLGGLLPAAVPVYFWNESLQNAVFTCICIRYVYQLNLTSLINSWAHLYGNRPYDASIGPVDISFMRSLLFGDAFHNFHHTFPYDYSSSELGPLDIFSPATLFIDFCHFMGWATELRKASQPIIEMKVKKYGKAEERLVRTNSLLEWTAGVLFFLMPWFGLRWFLMWIS